MRHLPQLVLDALALGGLAAMVRGVDLIYRPAAWILGGLFLFLGAVAMTRPPRGR